MAEAAAKQKATTKDEEATEAKCVKMEAFLRMHQWRRPKERSQDPEERKLRKSWDELLRRHVGPIGQGAKPSEQKLSPQASARVERIEVEISRWERRPSPPAASTVPVEGCSEHSDFLERPRADQERQIRRYYIKSRDLDKYGYTPGCPACDKDRAGVRRGGVNHTPGCRTRIESAISADPHRSTRWNVVGGPRWKRSRMSATLPNTSTEA